MAEITHVECPVLKPVLSPYLLDTLYGLEETFSQLPALGS